MPRFRRRGGERDEVSDPGVGREVQAAAATTGRICGCRAVAESGVSRGRTHLEIHALVRSDMGIMGTRELSASVQARSGSLVGSASLRVVARSEKEDVGSEVHEMDRDQSRADHDAGRVSRRAGVDAVPDRTGTDRISARLHGEPSGLHGRLGVDPGRDASRDLRVRVRHELGIRAAAGERGVLAGDCVGARRPHLFAADLLTAEPAASGIRLRIASERQAGSVLFVLDRAVDGQRVREEWRSADRGECARRAAAQRYRRAAGTGSAGQTGQRMV